MEFRNKTNSSCGSDDSAEIWSQKSKSASIVDHAAELAVSKALFRGHVRLLEIKEHPQT